VIRAFFAAALLLAAVAFAAADSPAPDERATALVEGKLPDDPALPLVQSRCLLCHSGDYLTQQRLTEGQWQRTVDKMRKFGTPANDEEAKAIVAYLARNWTVELPPPRPARAPPPRGSVPGK
jgi:Spy/CpxP family protein refolding chaperone